MPSREQASEIENDATVWAAKAERGLTSEERAAFEQWVEGDSRRLGAYVQAQAAWIHAERAGALGKIPEPVEAPLADVVAPDHARLLSRRMALGGGGAIAASVAAAYVFGFDRHRTLESGLGEIRHIALTGSINLVLDTDSRVDVALSSNDRRLELVRGKLYLNVMQRQELPLIVQAGGLLLETSLGAFSLQSLAKAPFMALVTGGALLVSQTRGLFGQRQSITVAQDHALTLGPDEKLTAGLVRPMPAAQQAQFLAWRDGMLSFGGERLADAVRAFDRYGPARILVADPALASQKVVGLFRATDPAGFAAAVAASFDGVVSRQGEVIRISAKKSSAS